MTRRAAGTRILIGATSLVAIAAMAACARPARSADEVTPTSSISSVAAAPDGPEQRAVAYLAGQVERWRPENGCFSCHNNGDAARALMTADGQSFVVKEGALAETLRFIASPDLWDANGKGAPAANDLALARVQFAAAHVTASELGYLRNPEALVRAARLVAETQSADGPWRIGPPDLVGSPATYGPFLGTVMALRTLRRAQAGEFAERVKRAEVWLRTTRPSNVLDAAALLMDPATRTDRGAVERTEMCLDLIRRGQGANGGWGPYVNSPAEVFDTAVVLIALSGLASMVETTELQARGRAYLLSTQEPGGGWMETTRPSGSESYAQHISTTGWATLALLATRE